MFAVPAIVGAGAALAGFAAAATPIATVAGVGLSAYSLMNQPKAPKAAGQVPGPAAPTPGASLDKAQQDATNRMRMIAASGGQTSFAGMGNTAIDPSLIQRKTLLGQ